MTGGVWICSASSLQPLRQREGSDNPGRCFQEPAADEEQLWITHFNIKAVLMGIRADPAPYWYQMKWGGGEVGSLCVGAHIFFTIFAPSLHGLKTSSPSAVGIS